MVERGSRGVAMSGESVGRLLQTPGLIAVLSGILVTAYWVGGAPGLAGAGLALAGAGVLPLASQRMSVFSNTVDGETGLPDEAAATARLEALAKSGAISGRQVAAIAIGFDRIDELRDRLGDTAIGRIRREAAARITRSVRESDVVATLDDATFAIVLEGLRRADLEMLLQITARMQRELSEPFVMEEARTQITVSAGFCLPNQAPDPSARGLLSGAQRALAAARRETGGAIRAYSGEMLVQDRIKTEFAESAVAALAHGDIRPWFQPQACARTGALTGVEALARWVKPTGEVLAPAEFMPALKAEGLSGRLGEQMLTHALCALSDWDAAGLEVPGVSVNLSRSDLWNPRFVDKVRWELDRFDIAAGRLTLEVREMASGRGPEDTALRNLRELARLGCAIDLDDFGTGGAPLAQLRQAPIGRIKIDRSFVSLVDRDADQQRMIAAIVMMAGRLELKTLAVGVETAGELEMLAKLGCNHVQGFAIASPMPPAAMPGFLSERTGRSPSSGRPRRDGGNHKRAGGGKTA